MTLNFPCKPSGLYILSKGDFDPLAYQILKKMQPAVLEKAMPLDLTALAEDGLYLECRDEILSQDGTILGLITFADQNLPVYDEQMNETAISTTEGTIVIDKRLHKKPTRYRFTMAHEIAHWILHRRFYSPIKKPYNFRNSGCSYIACRQEAEEGRKNPVEAKTDFDWSEWQSDGLAAALLMPACTFVPTSKEILHKHGFTEEKLVKGARDSKTLGAISEIAGIYNVSVRSASIRLFTFGFYAA